MSWAGYLQTRGASWISPSPSLPFLSPYAVADESTSYLARSALSSALDGVISRASSPLPSSASSSTSSPVGSSDTPPDRFSLPLPSYKAMGYDTLQDVHKEGPSLASLRKTRVIRNPPQHEWTKLALGVHPIDSLTRTALRCELIGSGFYGRYGFIRTLGRFLFYSLGQQPNGRTASSRSWSKGMGMSPSREPRRSSPSVLKVRPSGSCSCSSSLSSPPSSRHRSSLESLRAEAAHFTSSVSRSSAVRTLAAVRDRARATGTGPASGKKVDCPISRLLCFSPLSFSAFSFTSTCAPLLSGLVRTTSVVDWLSLTLARSAISCHSFNS
jgi:hypothetical protein